MKIGNVWCESEVNLKFTHPMSETSKTATSQVKIRNNMQFRQVMFAFSFTFALRNNFSKHF